MDLYHMFHPIIGVSYDNDSSYYEFPPSNDLLPYIRCFWGYRQDNENISKSNPISRLVIPDACSDIIFSYYVKEDCITCDFSTIDDEPGLPSVLSNVPSFTFSIRFYGWAVSAFTNDSLNDVGSGVALVEQYFPALENMIEGAIYEGAAVSRLICIVENYLRHHYKEKHVSREVIGAVGGMISSNGGKRIEEIAKENFVSKRQLERAFREHVGMTPKKVAGVIRYQLVWQDILRKGCSDINELLDKYKYADQAHFLNDFKNHHGMSWKEALLLYEQTKKV